MEAHPIVAAVPREASAVTHFAHMVLVTLASTVPGIAVRGNASCPTPGALESALVGLIAPPAARGPSSPDVVEAIVVVSDQGGTVTVRLSSARGEVIGEKRLPERLSCAERAQAAAVVVAAWEARLRGVAAEVRAPTQPPRVAVPPPAPPAAAVAARPNDRVAGAPAAPVAIQIETRAALLASVTSSGVAPAGTFEVAIGRADSPLAFGLGAVIVGGHTVSVASGRGVWRRFGGTVELDSVSQWSRFALYLHGGVALTAVTVEGELLAMPSGDTLFDPGVTVGLRLALATRLAPWVGATAVSWPRAHTLVVGGTPLTAQLPQFEAWLGAGLTFGTGK